MKKLINIVLFCLLTVCFAGSVYAVDIIEMSGDGAVKSAVVFNDEILQANTISWSDPVDISTLEFDDVRKHPMSVTLTEYNKASLTMMIARANTSTAAQNGGITLTYQVSNDGYGWSEPPAEDGEWKIINPSYPQYSWTLKERAGAGRTGKGYWGSKDDTGFTKQMKKNVDYTWAASTTAGTCGPYQLTLTSITQTFISPARYIRFGAVQPEASKSVIFDLVISGKGK